MGYAGRACVSYAHARARVRYAAAVAARGRRGPARDRLRPARRLARFVSVLVGIGRDASTVAPLVLHHQMQMSKSAFALTTAVAAGLVRATAAAPIHVVLSVIDECASHRATQS